MSSVACRKQGSIPLGRQPSNMSDMELGDRGVGAGQGHGGNYYIHNNCVYPEEHFGLPYCSSPHDGSHDNMHPQPHDMATAAFCVNCGSSMQVTHTNTPTKPPAPANQQPRTPSNLIPPAISSSSVVGFLFSTICLTAMRKVGSTVYIHKTITLIDHQNSDNSILILTKKKWQE